MKYYHRSTLQIEDFNEFDRRVGRQD